MNFNSFKLFEYIYLFLISQKCFGITLIFCQTTPLCDLIAERQNVKNKRKLIWIEPDISSDLKVLETKVKISYCVTVEFTVFP